MPNTISLRKRWEIVFLFTHRKGPKLSQAEVAREVRRSPQTVMFWLKRFNETGDVQEETQSGRPSKTSAKIDKMIVSLQKKRPKSHKQHHS